MKWIKRICVIIMSLPVILIIVLITFEIFGMCVNHLATSRQTKELQSNLENEIDGIKIIDVHFQTGNLSGTGNHVECLSVVTFSTTLEECEIKKIMSKYYNIDNQNCFLKKPDQGIYSFIQETTAPFPNNIEGH